MSHSFQGKVALVTGAGSGIGETTARAFAHAGASVMVADISPDGQAVADSIVADGGSAAFVQVDVSNAGQVERMVNETVAHFERLDFAFNNAGFGKAEAPIAEHDEDGFDQVIAVNLKGVFLCMKYQIHQFLKQGSGVIVNASSNAGINAMQMLAGYCASKAGVISLSKVAALEYAESNIRVNAICPGVVETQLIKKQLESSPDVVEHVLQSVPLKRFGQTCEIANAVLWLCSDEASFVTGATFPVDGGITAG